jgi:hypothetical protein
MKMKPIIEKIKLSKEEQDEVNRILKGEPVQVTYHYRTTGGHIIERVRNKKLTEEMAKRRLTQLLGGKCTGCGIAWPDYKFTYDVSSENQPAAKRIERYCGKCYNKK